MVRCIVLDGWHKGDIIDRPYATPTLTLQRPGVVTHCDCNPDEPIDIATPPGNVKYELAFTATDGETALYSTSGKSRVVWTEVNTIVQRLKPVGLDTVYLGCRDERAFP